MLKRISATIFLIVFILMCTAFVSFAGLGDTMVEESESNDIPDTANLVRDDYTVNARISSSTDIDCFKIVLTKTTEISVDVYSINQALMLALINSDAEALGITTNYVYIENAKVYASGLEGTLSAGTYYLIFADRNNSTQPYFFYYDEISSGTHTHSYTKTVTTKATCTKNGVATYRCSCGDSYTQVIKATGHSFKNYYSDNNATYVADGTKTATCANGCDATNTIPDPGSMKKLSTTGKITVTQNGLSVKLSWGKVTGATGYNVYQHTGGKWITLGNTGNRSYTVSSLEMGETYKFAVRPFAKSGSVTVIAPSYTTVSYTVVPDITASITVTQSGKDFIINWEAVEGATGYKVYQRVNDNWDSLKLCTDTTYTAKNLTLGESYKFAIKAYVQTENGTVWSPRYNSVTFTAGPEDSVITKATPSSTSVVLTWSKSASATGYYVYMYNNGVWEAVAYTTTETTATVTGLNPGTKYKFAVRPYAVIGSETIWSTSYEEYSVTTTGTAYPERTTTLKASSQTTKTVTLKWNAAKNAKGYRLFYKAPGMTSWKKINDTTALSYKVRGLKAGTKYTFAVRPYNNNGSEKIFAKKYLTIGTATCTATPELTSTRASSSKGKAYVYHSDVTGETGYTVYYSTSKTSGFKKYANFKADTTRCDITKLTSGKTYYFKVRTYIKTSSGYVYSPWSAVKSVKVK